ncbi:hypothetical protein AVEN_88288-1, partial [Araneus ventricosus]
MWRVRVTSRVVASNQVASESHLSSTASNHVVSESHLSSYGIESCADLHWESASLQQICHDKSASVNRVCSKLTQASKSPWDEVAANLHCKLIANYSKNK